MFSCHLFLISSASVAAVAAKSLQSCPTLCDPIDSNPQGSPFPGILQARTLEWVAISFFSAWKWKVKVKSLSCIRLFATQWTSAYQAPPSMGFSRQEYWSGEPLPYPSASVRSTPFLSFIVLISAWNVPLLSLIFLRRSLVFPILLFSSISFHWSLREGFLISPCYCLELCIQMGIYFLFSFAFSFSSFLQLSVRPPQTTI